MDVGSKSLRRVTSRRLETTCFRIMSVRDTTRRYVYYINKQPKLLFLSRTITLQKKRSLGGVNKIIKATKLLIFEGTGK